MSFPSVIELSALNGSDGFKISGEAADDRSGRSVASAGDVNGDGFADLIIGAYQADPNGLGNSGASYVVFGKAGGFAADLQLSALNGSDGFQISGEVAGDRSGVSVASAGDVNGDGFADVIIGAYRADANGLGSPGASYVVFGKAGGFAPSVELSALNGSNGFQISGEAAYDFSGRSVASAGDVNGDGFDDLIIGAYRAGPNGLNSGASYVVFGAAGGFAPNLDLSALNGSNGFQVSGETVDDDSGRSVAAAGDVNGDGFDDLIIGARGADPNSNSYSGASYVVFGKAGGFAPSLELSALNGTDGFQISGEAAGDRSGESVASAGDVNGDGFGDLIIGAYQADPNTVTNSGASYVVFGAAGGFAANLDLSTLNGSNGFRISGEALDDRSGRSVASAGDVNGDGFGDLIIGAHLADPNTANNSGASYVVFGKAGGFAPNLDLSALNGTNGFQINGEAASDTSGRSVASAGDVNGDGFGDLIIGADGADPNGIPSGASYVIYGRAPDTAVLRAGTAAANQISGGAFDDILRGFGGNDTLFGNGGKDDLEGGAGNDRLEGLAGSDEVQGAAGNDLLLGGDGNDALTAGSGRDRLLGGLGKDTLDGGLGNDTQTGGAGVDRFIFATRGDRDRITDFDAKGRVHDVLDISDLRSVTSFADLKANHMTRSGANVVINGGSGDVIVLVGVRLADLDAGDFLI